MGAACCAGAAVAGGNPSAALDGTLYGFLTAIPIALYHYYPQLSLILVTLLIIAASSFYLVIVLLTPVTKTSSPSELKFLSTASTEPLSLPSLLDELDKDGDNAAVQLSVVVPAYNEKERLPIMLKETVEFLESLREGKRSLADGPESKGKGVAKNGRAANGVQSLSKAAQAVHEALQAPLSTFEIIIVDDGSKDGTHQVALDFAKLHAPSLSSQIRVVRLVKNRGKGGAVRHGVLHSRGALILFADADGATSFADLSNLCRTLSHVSTDKGHAVAVGSRAHMVKSDAVVKRSFIRNFLMHSFHIFLTLLLRPPTLRGLLRKLTGGKKKASGKKAGCNGTRTTILPVQPEIKDTQCGFKLFTRPTAQLVFPASHIDGWIFDVELLILAQTSSNLAMQIEPPSEVEETEAEEEPLKGLAVPIAEVAVHWQEVGGSKIDLVRDSIRMALDLIVIRANYGFGRWKAPPPAL